MVVGLFLMGVDITTYVLMSLSPRVTLNLLNLDTGPKTFKMPRF